MTVERQRGGRRRRSRLRLRDSCVPVPMCACSLRVLARTLDSGLRVAVQIVPARRDTAQPEFLWSVRAPASQFLISAKKLSQNPALSF